MRKQRHSLGALALASIVAAILAGCSGGGAGQTARATPTLAVMPTPAPVVVYQSAWPQGLDAWHPEAGWSIVNGAPQSDLSNDLHMTLPFQPTDQPYAITIPVQFIEAKAFGAGWSLGVAPTDKLNGYYAGVDNFPAPTTHLMFAQHPTIRTFVLPLDAQVSLQQPHDYEPGTRMHTYRIEVRGNRIDLLSDGREWSYATATTAIFAEGPLVLRTQSVAIRLGQVTVEAISK
jgi:hypothetical protein